MDKQRLAKFTAGVNTSCNLCNTPAETAYHIFHECNRVLELRNFLINNIHIQITDVNFIYGHKNGNNVEKKVMNLVYALYIIYVWKFRLSNRFSIEYFIAFFKEWSEQISKVYPSLFLLTTIADNLQFLV